MTPTTPMFRLVALLLLAAGCGPTTRPGSSDAPLGVDADPGAQDAAPGGDAAPLLPVQVVITADNAYSFGYGTSAGIDTFFQGSRATSAGEIFNCGEGPEAYLVPAEAAPAGAYLYIVTWDDLSVSQGVLGQFVRGDGEPVYTGDLAFEVCATGVDMQASTTGPTQGEIDAQISVCNAGSGSPTTTSAGWVNRDGAVTPSAVGALAIGEPNDPTPGGRFPPTCPTGSATTEPTIDTVARWMWYSPGGIADPFTSTGSNTFRAYLIFRLAAADIPPPID
ncbi:MAG: hypothetical protein R2939_21375 [Kofleriaceae bacterium]